MISAIVAMCSKYLYLLYLPVTAWILLSKCPGFDIITKAIQAKTQKELLVSNSTFNFDQCSCWCCFAGSVCLLTPNKNSRPFVLWTWMVSFQTTSKAFVFRLHFTP